MTSSSRQRAIITGAGSGIGRATAIAFAQSGMDLALVGRSVDKLQATAEQAQAIHPQIQVKIYSIDLTDLTSIQPKFTAIAQDFGGIDILVNNAGMGYTSNLQEMPLKDWQAVMDLNVTSVFQCCQAILPGMRDRHSGTILNIASIAGHQSFPGWGAYCVSKAALIMFSKVLAMEERTHGIRVTLISPGAVNTPIWDSDTVQADFDRSQMLTPDAIAQSILHAALLPSQAVIEELTLMPSAGAL
jgi:NADP-dependent 3-hydroxy acid dehydrogenase YdfG